MICSECLNDARSQRIGSSLLCPYCGKDVKELPVPVITSPLLSPTERRIENAFSHDAFGTLQHTLPSISPLSSTPQTTNILGQNILSLPHQSLSLLSTPSPQLSGLSQHLHTPQGTPTTTTTLPPSLLSVTPTPTLSTSPLLTPTPTTPLPSSSLLSSVTQPSVLNSSLLPTAQAQSHVLTQPTTSLPFQIPSALPFSSVGRPLQVPVHQLNPTVTSSATQPKNIWG